MSKTTIVTSLPPINILFEEVLQRELNQPAPPPTRRPSAWPGFPGLDKDALNAALSTRRNPPPPLQVGRGGSAPAEDALRSPSIFPSVHAGQSQISANNERYTAAAMNNDDTAQSGSSKRESWPDPILKCEDYDSKLGRLDPISMAPTGSPRLYDYDPPPCAPPTSISPCHCAMDRHIEQSRAAHSRFHAESPYAQKQQIPTPLPPAHGHTLVSFHPTPGAYPGRSFGVCMADILEFRSCLVDPDAPVLESDAEDIYITLEAKGYTTLIQKVSANCAHRRISRYNLAYLVAAEYDTFLRQCTFNPAGLKESAVVVRSVTELRLVNLFSRDGGKNWRVHVAYCK